MVKREGSCGAIQDPDPGSLRRTRAKRWDVQCPSLQAAWVVFGTPRSVGFWV